MRIVIVAGARPNFMKIAPIIHALQDSIAAGIDFSYRLVHTGQHYDALMSTTFFEELNIPTPDVNLGCGGGTQAAQTAAIMVAFEQELLMHPADLVLVVGDVTSTMACSIVAKKMHVKVAHVEAGIRSFDLTMPEEINRMVTDSITDYFFTTSSVATRNLLHNGVAPTAIHFVGNVMIDTLLKQQPNFRKPHFFDAYGLQSQSYFVLTLHRPSNVDAEAHLQETLQEILANTQGLPVIFPIHPRTAKIVAGMALDAPQLKIVAPLGYLEFNYLVQHAKAVITDSGGITEETTILQVPCLTLRDSTERPETVSIGTNELVGTEPKAIQEPLSKLFAGTWKKGGVPELWDGNAAVRIVAVLEQLIAS